MNIDNIINKRMQLNKELQFALATMERKDTIYEIKKQIMDNQTQCPHISDKYNWIAENGICPYCGKQLG